MEYKAQIDEVLAEFMKYSERVCSIDIPVNPELVIRFEKEFQVELPQDYKYLLSKTNGLFSVPYDIVGIIDKPKKYDLFAMYKDEHFDVIVPQFKYLVPFCWDNGNFYCFDTRVKTNGGASNPIIYWVSNYEYSEENPPKVEHECLADFIQEWILGTLSEWYNYDGSEK